MLALCVTLLFSLLAHFIFSDDFRYGDRSPVTIPGRIFAIIWVLMGLVIISIVTGGIVTSISSVLVIQEDKLYGAQVKF